MMELKSLKLYKCWRSERIEGKIERERWIRFRWGDEPLSTASNQTIQSQLSLLTGSDFLNLTPSCFFYFDFSVLFDFAKRVLYLSNTFYLWTLTISFFETRSLPSTEHVKRTQIWGFITREKFQEVKIMDKEEKRSVLCYVGRRRFDSLFIRKK